MTHKETPLVAAFGRDKYAIDIANNFNLKWCKRAIQMVLATMQAHQFIHRGKLGLMLEPVRRVERLRDHHRAAAAPARVRFMSSGPGPSM